jgi:hypothetical protein
VGEVGEALCGTSRTAGGFYADQNERDYGTSRWPST